MYSLLLSANHRNNRDQVYTPTSKMTKTIRNNMKQWFQTLNNRQLRTVIPDRGETKRDVLRLSQLITWKETTDHIPGRENPGKSQW